MSGTNAEMMARARLRVDPHRVMCHAEEMAFALGYEAATEAADLTSAEDQMYVKRMEAERDAALAVIAEARAASAALDRQTEESEDVSYYWSEAFDAVAKMDDALAKVAQ